MVNAASTPNLRGSSHVVTVALKFCRLAKVAIEMFSQIRYRMPEFDAFLQGFTDPDSWHDRGST